MADRVPDGRGDAADLRRGRAQVCGRLADPRGPGLDAEAGLLVGAGALHLHVRVDGQVRRRVRRAHRHSRGRRRDDQPPPAPAAQGIRAVRPARRRAVHRDRRDARRIVRLGHRAYRFGIAGPGNPEVDRLSVHSARLVPDVLPLPPGRVALPAQRESAAPRRRARRGDRRGGGDPGIAPGAGSREMTAAVAPVVPPGASRWPALIPILIIGIPVGLKLAGVPVDNPWIVFALLIGLMLTGMPVSISLGLTVLTYLFAMTTVPIQSVALKLFTGIEKFEIMAIPFFILAGNFLTHGGVARRMISFATSMVGHWYGGLALAGVMACALFAAVSGSSPATVVAIGSIILPAMVRQGFPKRFGAGVITTSGALGILIPPSIVMVMYSVATNGATVIGPSGNRVLSGSVGQLFMAGVVPGLILAAMLAATTWWRA